jgi:hypothetical protein
MGHISSSDGYSLLNTIDPSESFSVKMIPNPEDPEDLISQVEATQVKTQQITTLNAIEFNNGATWTCATDSNACSLSAPLSVTSMTAQDYSMTGANDFMIQQIEDPWSTDSQLVSHTFSTISEARNMVTEQLQFVDGGTFFGNNGETLTTSPIHVYSESDSSLNSLIEPSQISAPRIHITGTSTTDPILSAESFLQFKVDNQNVGYFNTDGFNTDVITLPGSLLALQDKVTNTGNDDVTTNDIILAYYGTASDGSWIVNKTFRQRLAQYTYSNNQWKIAWDQYQTSGWYRIVLMGT